MSALLRKKLAIRLQDAVEAMGVTNARNTSPERARHWLALELRDALLDLGKACSVADVLDQKQRMLTSAWMTGDRGMRSPRRCWTPPKEARALSTQLFRLRHAYEESTMSQETLPRENKNLQGTLSQAGSQSWSKELRESPDSRAKLLPWQMPQHGRGPTQVLTFTFLILKTKFSQVLLLLN